MSASSPIQNIPVIDSVDVVVAGGTTAGVAAAIAAANEGASVFLATALTYLGDDLCAHGRWWTEPTAEPATALCQALFRDSDGNPAPRTTPMTIKRALDEALIEAGVTFLFGCWPASLLRDQSGRAAGVVFATRNGLLAVRGKQVIDATWNGALARTTGETVPAAGPRPAVRYLVGAPAPEASGLACTELTPSVKFTTWDPAGRPNDHDFPAYRCELTVELADDSPSAFAAAENQARDATWCAEQKVGSEQVWVMPAPAIAGKARIEGAWPGAASADLGAFAAGVEGLCVAGPAAAVSAKAATALAHPQAMINLGTRLGAAAAAPAESVTLAGSLSVGPRDGGFDPGALRVNLAAPGLRASAPVAEYAALSLASLPVLAEVDVLVVGGGTGGAPAGISAARAGGRTLVTEALHGLGGVGTLGLIASYYFGYREGFTAEVNEGVAAYSGADPLKPRWNPAHKAEWLRQQLLAAGGELWLGSVACGVAMEGSQIRGVVIATPQGVGVVRTKTVIDSTGNGDISALAGAECRQIRAAHLAVQGTGLPPIFPGIGYFNTDYTFVDDCDLVDNWRAFIVGRSKYRQQFDMGQLVDTRERRQIVGDVELDPVDVYRQRTWPDTVSIHRSNFDTHGFTIHPMFLVVPPDHDSWDANVPLRALMPKGIGGVLATGLGVSAHRDVMPIIRMQACVQNQGYAVGLAAVMALAHDGDLRAIDIRALQRKLVEVNCLPEAVLSQGDSFPEPLSVIEEAVASGIADHASLATVFANPAAALPLLRDAYATAAGETRQRVAQALAVLGDGSGAATLREALAAGEWDEGWNYRGMGQFGRSLSPVDDLIVALGLIADEAAKPLIREKAAALDESQAFSHHRAVAMATVMLGDTAAAPVLASVLAKPGIGGHAISDIHAEVSNTPQETNDTSTRNVTLRELVLAAALYRLGDHDGLGKATLEAYSRDFRGHYVRYATSVLAEKA